jgi:hypothetical protein
VAISLRHTSEIHSIKLDGRKRLFVARSLGHVSHIQAYA